MTRVPTAILEKLFHILKFIYPWRWLDNILLKRWPLVWRTRIVAVIWYSLIFSALTYWAGAYWSGTVTTLKEAADLDLFSITFQIILLILASALIIWCFFLSRWPLPKKDIWSRIVTLVLYCLGLVFVYGAIFSAIVPVSDKIAKLEEANAGNILEYEPSFLTGLPSLKELGNYADELRRFRTDIGYPEECPAIKGRPELSKFGFTLNKRDVEKCLPKPSRKVQNRMSKEMQIKNKEMQFSVVKSRCEIRLSSNICFFYEHKNGKADEEFSIKDAIEILETTQEEIATIEKQNAAIEKLNAFSKYKKTILRNGFIAIFAFMAFLGGVVVLFRKAMKFFKPHPAARLKAALISFLMPDFSKTIDAKTLKNRPAVWASRIIPNFVILAIFYVIIFGISSIMFYANYRPQDELQTATIYIMIVSLAFICCAFLFQPVKKLDMSVAKNHKKALRAANISFLGLMITGLILCTFDALVLNRWLFPNIKESFYSIHMTGFAVLASLFWGVSLISYLKQNFGYLGVLVILFWVGIIYFLLSYLSFWGTQFGLLVLVFLYGFLTIYIKRQPVSKAPNKLLSHMMPAFIFLAIICVGMLSFYLSDEIGSELKSFRGSSDIMQLAIWGLSFTGLLVLCVELLFRPIYNITAKRHVIPKTR